MKTKSFLLGAASLMLAASCSNDEVVNVAPQSGAIGFSSFVNNSTRAKDNTSDNLNDFNVYGVSYRDVVEGEDGAVSPFAVFAGDKVSKTGITNGELSTDWKYENTRYWINGNTYTFAAVAPYGAAEVEQSSEEKTNGGITSIKFVNNGEVDLLYDSPGNFTGAASMSAVAFNFKHLLSRVMFEFVNGLPEGYSVGIKDVKITNAGKKSTYSVAEGSTQWAWSTPTETTEFAFPNEVGQTSKTIDEENNTKAINATTEPMYLIPTTAKYNATFTLVLHFADAIDGKDVEVKSYNHTVELPEVAYALGYSYVFKTTVNAKNIIGDDDDELEPIEFTVTGVDGWKTDADNSEQELPTHKVSTGA